MINKIIIIIFGKNEKIDNIFNDLSNGKYEMIYYKTYNRNFVEDNGFTFSPHITFLKIQDSKIFENHRENIENIIREEIKKINELDLNSKNIYLYAVNSKFKEEIQIKL